MSETATEAVTATIHSTFSAQKHRVIFTHRHLQILCIYKFISKCRVLPTKSKNRYALFLDLIMRTEMIEVRARRKVSTASGAARGQSSKWPSVLLRFSPKVKHSVGRLRER